ncbi:hypothetical protein [Bordetella flabilis]|uniref:Uncharacterized protein n=1 Tax=Bordetella flabilis TaxID=463014 RepID=A0A193GNB3_9BORD|nr:hypothetical protein [Bordetella flabilis]ANN80859.1 hypothetical protein BAU07_26420 [Bordetella flabilis]
MKTMKFQPGTYLEMDDLAGGRKVVCVGRDGSTYWDMLDADRITPIVIHPSQNPKGLGSIADFLQASGLQDTAQGVIDHLRDQGLDPEGNALFVMRVLWEMARNSDESMSGDALYGQAVRAAQAQEAAALRIHARAAQYSVQQ